MKVGDAYVGVLPNEHRERTVTVVEVGRRYIRCSEGTGGRILYVPRDRFERDFQRKRASRSQGA